MKYTRSGTNIYPTLGEGKTSTEKCRGGGIWDSYPDGRCFSFLEILSKPQIWWPATQVGNSQGTFWNILTGTEGTLKYGKMRVTGLGSGCQVHIVENKGGVELQHLFKMSLIRSRTWRFNLVCWKISMGSKRRHFSEIWGDQFSSEDPPIDLCCFFGVF